MKASQVMALIVIILLVFLAIPMLQTAPLPDWFSPGGGTQTTTSYTTTHKTTTDGKPTVVTTEVTATPGFNIRPYSWTVVYDDGTQDTLRFLQPWPMYMPGPDGGGREIISLKNVQFDFWCILRVDGSLPVVPVEVRYEITVSAEGKTLGRDSGVGHYMSEPDEIELWGEERTTITHSALSITQYEFRTKLGDGYHKVTYKCTATAYMMTTQGTFTNKVDLDLVISPEGMTVSVA